MNFGNKLDEIILGFGETDKKLVNEIREFNIELAYQMALRIRGDVEPVEEKKEEIKENKNNFKDWICDKVPIMNVMYDAVCDYSDQRYRLIKGAIQSGKTKAIIAHALVRIKTMQRSSVVIVRNMIGDAVQFQKQADNFFNEYFQTRSIPDVNFRPQCITMNEVSSHIIDADEIFEVLTNGGIVVCLANGFQIKKLLEIIGDRKINFDLLVDEVDEINYRGIDATSSVPFYTYYEELQELCFQKIGITATTLEEVLGNTDLMNKNIFNIPLGRFYKGIDKIIKVPLKYKITPSFKSADNYFDCDPRAIEYYEELTKQKGFEYINPHNEKCFHPIVCLHKTSSLTKHHYQILNTFANDFRFCNDWGVITYNSDGVNIYCNGFKGKTIRMKVKGGEKRIVGTKVSFNDETSKFETSGDKHSKTGIHSFKKGEISDALQLFKNFTRIERILIISGNMASRGTNFVSADYMWHITHMYLLTSKTGSTSDLLQACRICGVYQDDLPLVLNTTQQDIDDIEKTVNVQEYFVNKCCQNEIDKQTTKIFPEIPITKTMLPKKVLCKHHEYKTQLNIVKTLDAKEDVKDKGKYLVVNLNALTGIIKLMVDHTIKILSENFRGKNIARTIINSKLLELDEVKFLNRDQLDGHWNNRLTGILTDDINISGLLYFKDMNKIFFRYN